MGIKVDWSPHTLQVSVKPDHESYLTRQKAFVEVQVLKPDGKPAAKETEVLLAVVDEGLLQLQENRTWKLLDSMMGSRPYRVNTATAQMQVVGKRHFGLKAKAPGGDGGVSSAREVFDTLVYFQARAKTDAQGRVRVEFPLNDSLSSFRVVAVAHSGIDRFGTGSGSFRTTQDFSLSSSLPTYAREGDRFPFETVARNTTQSSKRVRISLEIAGDQKERTALSKEIALKPGQSERVSFPGVTLAGIGKRSVLWSLKDSFKTLDQVKTSFEVLPRVETHVEQSIFESVGTSGYHAPIRAPEGAIAGRTQLEIQMSSRLTDTALAGVSDYMVHYPYSCFEQRLSKAITLSDQKAMDQLLVEAPNYTDSNGMIRYFPSDLNFAGSVMLTVETLRLLSESQVEIPRLVRERWLGGLQRFVENKLPRLYDGYGSELSLMRLAAIETLSRYGEFELQLIPTLNLPIALLPVSSQIDLALLGRRVPLSPHADIFEQARKSLQSRVSYRGSIMQFDSEGVEANMHELNTPDAVAAKLVLLSLIDSKWESERGRLMRGLLARTHSSGSWDSTYANSWAVLAARSFSRIVEKGPVEGKTTVELGSKSKDFVWNQGAAKHSSADWPVSDSKEIQGELQVHHKGAGAPWMLTQLSAAIPRTQPTFAGYQLTKRWSDESTRVLGGVTEVELEFESDRNQTWVAIRDPIPAGAVVLGSGLGGDASGSAPKVIGDTGDFWNAPQLAFEERVKSEYRAYFSFLPKGKFKIRYRLRWNQPGSFYVPETRIESMYAPEVYAEIPGTEVTVRETK